jgi:hypothetical protein
VLEVKARYGFQGVPITGELIGEHKRSTADQQRTERLAVNCSVSSLVEMSNSKTPTPLSEAS